MPLTTVERPFSVLQQLVPDPPSLPLLAPLIDIQSEATESVEVTPAPKEASQPPEEKDNSPIRGPSSLPLPALSSILADAGRNLPPNPSTALSTIGKRKLQHWTITRNPPRNRARDAEDNEDSTGAHLGKRRRVVEAMDYGSFSQLTGLVAAENGVLADDFDEVFGTEEKFLNSLKISLEKLTRPAEMQDKMDIDGEKALDLELVVESDEYVRDVVYGGIDGLAYVRSLAEFVSVSRCLPNYLFRIELSFDSLPTIIEGKKEAWACLFRSGLRCTLLILLHTDITRFYVTLHNHWPAGRCTFRNKLRTISTWPMKTDQHYGRRLKVSQSYAHPS